jgi:hypothetical protein
LRLTSFELVEILCSTQLSSYLSSNHINGNDKARTVGFQARIQPHAKHEHTNIATNYSVLEMGAHTVLATHTNLPLFPGHFFTYNANHTISSQTVEIRSK